MIPGDSPFESDGMLVYGQPTTPDGRVEVVITYIRVLNLLCFKYLYHPIAIIFTKCAHDDCIIGSKQKLSESASAGWSIIARG